MKLHFSILLAMLGMIALPSCSPKSSYIKREIALCPINTLPQNPTNAPESITIWIHGTRFILPIDAFVHACPPGIHKATDLPKKYLLKRLITATAEADPATFPLDTFYVFGWSGDLSFKEREKDARKLYQGIKELVARYETTYGHTPKINLITHSHGGNVALNLAKIRDPKDSWTITQAIFLGCPIQEQTKNLARNPFFKKIYSIYSSLDSIQLLDPQGLYKNAQENGEKTPTFSQRRFPASNNLHQVKLKIHGHGVMHIGFITRSFTQKLPAILKAIDTWDIEEQGITTGKKECILSITYDQSACAPARQAS